VNFILSICQPDLTREIYIYGVGTAIIGVIQMVLGYLSVYCLNAAAENQVNLINIYYRLLKLHIVNC
jgi:hypothetical protein